MKYGVLFTSLVILLLSLACGSAEPAEAREQRAQPITTTRVGEPVSPEYRQSLLAAGWLEATVVSEGELPVSMGVSASHGPVPYDVVSRTVAKGSVLFLERDTGRVIYQQGSNPGLVHELAAAGYVLEFTSAPAPTHEELLRLTPVPESILENQVVPGGLTTEQIQQLLASGWKELAPETAEDSPMLFARPSSLYPEGLYLGTADLTQLTQPNIGTVLNTGDECTCYTPECGNPYKCPCYALASSPKSSR